MREGWLRHGGPPQQPLQLLCFWSPGRSHGADEKCGGGGGGGVRGRGTIFEHCHSEAWTPAATTSSPSLLSLPLPSLLLFSPGFPFPCVIRLLIKAVDVERMNAHSVYLSLAHGMEPSSCTTKCATERPSAGFSDKFCFCVLNIELRLAMKLA